MLSYRIRLGVRHTVCAAVGKDATRAHTSTHGTQNGSSRTGNALARTRTQSHAFTQAARCRYAHVCTHTHTHTHAEDLPVSPTQLTCTCAAHRPSRFAHRGLIMCTDGHAAHRDHSISVRTAHAYQLSQARIGLN